MRGGGVLPVVLWMNLTREAYLRTTRAHEIQSVLPGRKCVAVLKTMGFSVLLQSFRLPSHHFHPSK